jgi:SAM-dependent methyltransferase
MNLTDADRLALLSGLDDAVAQDTGVAPEAVREILASAAAHGALVANPVPESGHHITRYVMYQRIRQFMTSGEHTGRVLEISGDRGAIHGMFDPARIEYVSTDPAAVDVCELPFDAESFDYIICDQVIEHVEDPFRGVREMRRVLRPGGWLILATAFMDPVHERADNTTDYWRFTPRGMAALLRDFSLLYQCEGWGNREALAVVLFGGSRKYTPVEFEPGLLAMTARNELDVPLSVWGIARK